MKKSRKKTRARLPVESEKSAGAVVFFRGAQIEYLLLFSRFLGFPKGHIERGEKERESAAREVREETGLEVTLLDGFRETDEYWYRRKDARVHKRAVFFLAQAQHRDSKISWEHEEMAWLSFDEAMVRLTYENGRKILIKANEFLKRSNVDRR